MGNFLSNVAAKALGQASTLRPKIPSLFEPPPAAMATRFTPAPRSHIPSEIRGGAESVVPETTSHGGVHTGPPLAERPPLRENRHPSLTDTVVEPAFKVIPAIPPIDRKAVAVTTLLGNELEPSPRTFEPAYPEAWVTPSPRITAKQQDSDVLDGPAERKPSGLVPRRVSSQANVSVDKVLREERPESGEPKSMFSTGRSDPAAQRQASHVAEQPAALIPVRPEAQLGNAEIPPDSNVSVVIGRVVVQAVLPPAPPLRVSTPPPAPMLSLEQYLRERGGY